MMNHSILANLNVLQVATLEGDIRLVEGIVAIGAALDFPVLAGFHPNMPRGTLVHGVPVQRAPDGATALLLVCLNFAMYSSLSSIQLLSFPPAILGASYKIAECAAYLVELGADTSVRLSLPSNPAPMGTFDSEYLRRGFGGKSCLELISLCASFPPAAPLIAAISRVNFPPSPFLCRCGSHLPWLSCHSHPSLVASTPISEQNTGSTSCSFRYSPLAPCPCKHNKKTYMDCCWLGDARPMYQNDKTGELFHVHKLAVTEAVARQLAEGMQAEIHARGAKPDDKVFTPGLPNEYQKHFCRMIREYGFVEMGGFLPGFRPRSTWKEDVYAGCVERLADYFVWDDYHYGVNGAELESRVRDWNEALDKYCDDEGIEGKEREKVVKDHLALPFAPCGNMECAVVETTLKEFARCGSCKRISYCSPNCQKTHWKHHKPSCKAGHSVV